MPQYSLSEYMTHISTLIQDGQIEEAIAHTRHVLSHHPRYLPAYSLLARASLEKGDLSHASHFYQSILSANPEDVDAWVHLAQLSDDLGEVEQAIWHLERATASETA
jgi:predicted Zn-dependent protease